MDVTKFAIEQAIATMWNRYDEALSREDIADSALLSGFHFSRAFRSITGMPSGRFLSVIRLYKAKHLLLQTPLSVADVARRVGYTSPGAFTRRFARSVGASPGRYRLRSQAGRHAVAGGCEPGDPDLACEVTGRILAPHAECPVPTRTYVGLFCSPVIEGQPVVCDVLDGCGSGGSGDSDGYRLRGVPPGTWHLRAVTVEMAALDPRPWARRPRYLGAGEAVVVRRDSRPVRRDVVLRTATLVDLPILLALPELDNFSARRDDA